MSLGNYKIKDTDIASKGVVAAPDKLTGSAEENKKIFDRLIRETVKGDFNGLIDALTAAGVEHMALLPENAAGFKYIRLNSDKVLEVSTDGKVWQATGSSGHLIIGPDGQALPPAEPDAVHQRHGGGPERRDRGGRRKGRQGR